MTACAGSAVLGARVQRRQQLRLQRLCRRDGVGERTRRAVHRRLRQRLPLHLTVCRSERGGTDFCRVRGRESSRRQVRHYHSTVQRPHAPVHSGGAVSHACNLRPNILPVCERSANVPSTWWVWAGAACHLARHACKLGCTHREHSASEVCHRLEVVVGARGARALYLPLARRADPELWRELWER
jgi:hypothetical protein